MNRRTLLLPVVFVFLVLGINLLQTSFGPASTDPNQPPNTQGEDMQILFFQGSAHCDECLAQEEEIEVLKQRIPEIRVLTYDVDTDQLVADRHNVWVVPTVIINEQKYEGLVIVDELQSILEKDEDQVTKKDALSKFPLGFALLAGALTGLGPCALAFSGVVALFIFGSSLTEKRAVNIASTSLFALTRASVFACFGFAVGALGASARDLRFILLIAAAGIAFFVGSSYLGWIDLPLATVAPNSKKMLKLRRGYLTPILLGLVFGFAVLPCATPVMAAMLAFVATTQQPGLGVLCLFLFGMGLSAPVIVFGFFGETYRQKARRLLSWGRKFNITLGLSLLALSIVLLLMAF